MTSIRRRNNVDNVVSTLMRHCMNAMCSLEYNYNNSDKLDSKLQRNVRIERDATFFCVIYRNKSLDEKSDTGVPDRYKHLNAWKKCHTPTIPANIKKNPL